MYKQDMEILRWLQEERLVTEFIIWASDKTMKPIARATYYRATIYRDKNIPDYHLPMRQQKALSLARQFADEKRQEAGERYAAI